MSLLKYIFENIDEVSLKIELSVIEFILNLSIEGEVTGICRTKLVDLIKNRRNGIYFIKIVYGARIFRFLLVNGKIINAEALEMKKRVLTGRKVVEELDRIDTICRIMIYTGEIPVATWRERFIFGIPEIDEVHREMIDLLNLIIKNIVMGNIKSLNKLINELYEHTVNKHFKLEEDLMIKYNYPGYNNHLKYHKMYIEVLEEMISQVENEDYTGLLTSILTLLESYLDYLEEEDQKMARYIKGFIK